LRVHARLQRDALARDAALRRAHASMADEEQPRLPDYFPLAPKGCAKQANAFFECFAAAGAQAPDTAVRASIRRRASRTGSARRTRTRAAAVSSSARRRSAPTKRCALPARGVRSFALARSAWRGG
jgi:hypothetical protein